MGSRGIGGEGLPVTVSNLFWRANMAKTIDWR